MHGYKWTVIYVDHGGIDVDTWYWWT